MKKVLLSFSLVLLLVSGYSQVKVCVYTGTGSDGHICVPSNLGPVNPCATLSFRVREFSPVPTGYALVYKFEWFVNGSSVKSTFNASDVGLDWAIKSNFTDVYCVVTYIKNDGMTLSSPYVSNTFTPIVKQLNFVNDIIQTGTVSPYGCSGNNVSYTINTFNCSPPFCDAVFIVSNYNITWQAPAGWVQNSISSDTKTVSFTPDAFSSGPLKATITLPCGYSEVRTFNINRPVGAPTFISFPTAVCSSGTTISINAICGANYTYSITAPAGITFTANGQQQITTTNTSVNLSLSGAPSDVTISAKANYGSTSSANTNKVFIYGSQTPTNIIGFNPPLAVSPGELLELDADNNSIQAYDWSVEGGTISGYSNQSHVTIQVDQCYGSTTTGYINIHLAYNNGCGLGNTYTEYTTIDCGTGGGPAFAISPNPATDNVKIDGTKKSKVVKEVQVVDKYGNVKKIFKFSQDERIVSLNISTLPPEIYFIKIFDGEKWESKQLMKQ